MSTGLPELIKERLQIENAALQNIEKYCSLLVDEMAIKSNVQYDRMQDRYTCNTVYCSFKFIFVFADLLDMWIWVPLAFVMSQPTDCFVSS